MDDKDVIIAQLQQENAELRALIAQLRDEIARLKNQNSSNSSKPPSSDIVNPQPRVRRKKRKRGGQSGHRRCQRQLLPPEQVDETILHELPADEVQRRRLTPLDEYEPALQQIDLPKKMIHVTEHHVRLYQTPTGRIVKAKPPSSAQMKRDMTMPACCTGYGVNKIARLPFFTSPIRVALRYSGKFSARILMAFFHATTTLPIRNSSGII